VRWDSPIVLVIAGTIAIHTILLVFVDAMIVTHPIEIRKPAPKLEMFEVKVEPPPPPKLPQIQPRIEPPIVEPVRIRPRAPDPEPPKQPPPPTTPTPTPTSESSGGGPVLNMPDLAPDARGTVAVVAGGGKQVTRPGRGGSGSGTGGGSGSGHADLPPPPPVSIATIKSPAMPRGDYGYIDASRDYPVEAKQLGIEGPIRVRLIVDATGKVVTATLLNRLGHGLDELALERAKKIQFDPAKDTDDRPVTSVVVWTFNMTLPKK
jgi:periplasmic protein TonB